ncbi:MAG: CPBP family intramembrane metalloprotease [Firmicutes bacterium]|nr:CPBP family intramembrane metalloprotease [Bacillota bacterium]
MANSSMNRGLDRRRIGLYVAFSFGIAWANALAIHQTGGLVRSPEIIPGTGLTMAMVLLATGYMWAPALAHILTRAITREGWQGMFLEPRFRKGWPYWLAGWLAPAILTLAGAIVFFMIFPRYFDPSLKIVKDMIMRAERVSGRPVPIIPWMMVVFQAAQAVLIAPVINGLFTFGEEFGWRAYLLPKLLPLGGRKASVLMGMIWGAWHWPIIAMGHNYGLDYQGAPWLGMCVMVWFTLVVGTFLGWITLRGGSVWPAVISHGAINGIAGIGILFIKGRPSSLLGPMPTGIIASIPWALLAAWIFLRRGALEPGPSAALGALGIKRGRVV